jgi:hypothetical protein
LTLDDICQNPCVSLSRPYNFLVRENQVPAVCTKRSENGQLPLHTCTGSTTAFFRKEVIQPQVLLRLPCYDFTPIMGHTLGACLLAVSTATSSTAHFRDVTGGVYKARERIHGADLMRHY